MSDFIRRLHYGDNLQVLQRYFDSESVDLVYLDPPFNSKRLYNVYLDAEAQSDAFDDTWTWTNETEADLAFVTEKGPPCLASLLHDFRQSAGVSTAAYLVMMSARLVELDRVLKPTGSLYLHCDPNASHYLKTVMDAIFGRDNFRNDVIWKRTYSHGGARKWGAVHDDLLFYTKSNDYTWNTTYVPYRPDYADGAYDIEDEDGRRYQAITLTGSGPREGESGSPWKGVNPTAVGRHWAIPRKNLSDLGIAAEIPTEVLLALDELDSRGLIYWPKNGDVPRFKRYLDSTQGTDVQDVIDDIKPLSKNSAERLGYPTQKPIALLERILSASSEPGDLVLDPFCGCGTAVEAAEKLGRQSIGIDITHLAISLVEKRLSEGFGPGGPKWEVIGTPKDLAAARDLAARDKHQFQYWACSLVRAWPSFSGKVRKGADKGIDGVILFNDEGPRAKPKKIIVSVKGGEHVSSGMIRNLRGTIEREGAAIGLFITLAEPTRHIKLEAADAGLYMPAANNNPAGSAQVPRIQVLRIEDLLKGHGPSLPPDFTTGTITFKRNRPTTSPKPKPIL
jgi:site-specific DNA-methyltransferase (adenine-specific)